MSDETQIQDDASLLERFLTFLGRPQYIVTAALGGLAEGVAKGSLDPVGEGIKDAAANAYMFGQELGTGSWLHGMAPNNLVGLPTDLTTREDRPEVSDILRRADLPAPEQGSWAELGVNVLGGIPLDPLTYLGGIGLGAKAGRLAKAAVKGTEVVGDLVGLGAKGAAHEAAAARAAAALRQTEKGAAMLAEAADDPKLLVERLLAKRDFDGVKATAVEDLASKLRADDAFKAEVASRLAAPRGAASPVLGSLDEVLPGAALTRAKELLGLDPTGVSSEVRLLGTMDQAPLLNASIDALEGAKALKPMGVPTFEVPFTKWWKALPWSPELWDKVGIWTPARIANSLLAKASPEAATAFADVAARTNARISRMFYSKVAGLAPQAFLDVGRQIQGEEAANKAAEWVAATKAFDGVDEGAANVIGRTWNAIGDRWWDLDRHGAEHMASVTSAAVDKIRSSPFGGTAMLEASANALPWATKATTGMDDDALKSLRLAFTAGRVEVAEAVHAAGGNVDAALRALDHMVDTYGRMPAELVQHGAWEKAAANPFYMPHQASEALARFMSAGAGTRKAGGQTYQAALQSVFHNRRQYPQVRDFYAALNEVADRFKVPRPDIDDLLSHADLPASGADPRDMLAARRGATVEAAHDVAETNAFNLLLRRIDSHRDVIAARRVEAMAKEAFPGLRHASTLDRYLDGALAPIGARQNTLLKILGGGEFRIGESAIGEAGLAQLERLKPVLGGARGAKATPRGAEQAFVYRWPGVSSFVKPLLLAGPSFFSRNAIGGVVAASLDPEIGVRGAMAIGKTLKDLPLVYALGRHGFAPSDTGLMIRAVEGGVEALSPSDLVRLQSLEFGGRKAADLIEPLRAGVLLPNTHHDLDFMTAIGDASHIAETVRKEAQSSVTGAAGGLLTAYREASRAFKGEINSAWAPAMVDTFRALMKPLSVINSKIENSLRTAAWLHYVGKGWDPATASAKVRERFVDYAFNSNTERAVRDLFPFARYSIGITPTAVKGATSPVGRAVGRAVSTPAEQAILPPGVRGQTSIPWGEDDEGNPRYITNLGLPFEPAMGVLGLLGLPVTAAAGAVSGDARQRALDTVRTTLGQAHPWLKTPAEIVTGSSFYSGQPIGERDRAPEWAPSWLPGVREETLPSGRTIKKWPPFAAHALMGFLPISRLSSEFDKFVKATHGDTADYVNFLFGVKIRTVDTEREAQKVIERALEQAVAAGDVGRVNKFFVKGRKEDADPEVLLALEQLALLEKKRRARSR